MRSLMYKVRDNEGNEFTTTRWEEATKEGNHLISHLMVKDEVETEKVKERKKTHAQKIMEAFGIKGK